MRFDNLPREREFLLFLYEYATLCGTHIFAGPKIGEVELLFAKHSLNTDSVQLENSSGTAFPIHFGFRNSAWARSLCVLCGAGVESV